MPGILLEKDKPLENLAKKRPTIYLPGPQRGRLLAGAAILGGTLAMGFLPTASSLGAKLAPFLHLGFLSENEIQSLGFILLALVFLYSIPPRYWVNRDNQLPPDLKLLGRFFTQALVPMILAAVFGIFLAQRIDSLADKVWLLVAIPIGEELLFRGWLYALTQRLFRADFFSPTNPLPPGVWASATAFSLWHLQNLNFYSPGLVIFQVFFTFWLGMWLGFVRWRTGTLWIPVLLHSAVNLSSILFS